jgi:hypothetical protein
VITCKTLILKKDSTLWSEYEIIFGKRLQNFKTDDIVSYTERRFLGDVNVISVRDPETSTSS